MDITKKDIDNWAKKQPASSIGQSFEVAHADERGWFVDWFYETLSEIIRNKPPMD